MSNVLPKKELLRVRRGFRARSIFVGSAMFAVGAVIASLALVPTYLSLRIAQSALTNAQQDLSETAKSDQSAHARALATVNSLKAIQATTSPSTVLEHALMAKPPGLSITSLRYSKGQFVLSGISSNRQATGAFRDALDADDYFTAVALPVAALVGAQDGRFTITLSGAF